MADEVKRCEVCGESECWALADWSMGGAPGEYEEAMAKHYRIGYEREKARAEKAEASRDEWRKDYVEASVTGRFPISSMDDDPAIAALREDAEYAFHGRAYAEMAKRAKVAQEALAAARRECEGWTAENAALWARIRTLELEVACHDAAKARAEAALEKAVALAAPAAGEEGKR